MRADPALASSNQIGLSQHVMNMCVVSSVCEVNLLTECNYLKKRICVLTCQTELSRRAILCVKVSKAEPTEKSAGIN